MSAERLRAVAWRLQRWLLNEALPLWWERGADHAHGGFFDRLDLVTGMPVGGATRLRVQARQAHVYALASQLGWSGPAEAASRHGLAAVRAARCDDGLYRMAPYPEPLDGMGLVYDQAFVLLALASHHAAFGGETALEAEAAALADRLAEFAHPMGGYREAPGLEAPLFANPNMHLFEAFQAWRKTSKHERWRDLAHREAELCMDQLIVTPGFLPEVFDADWRAPAAPTYWPGHLYEWGFLLIEWDAVGTDFQSAERELIRIAESFGVDETRGVAIFSLSDSFAPLDKGARLWAQTERARACARAAITWDAPGLLDAAAQAAGAMEAFLHVPTPGLWRDWMDEDGAFREEPAPASSLYHVVGAIAELTRVARAAR